MEAKDIKSSTEDLKKMIEKMKSGMGNLHSNMADMMPELMKETEIEGCKCKVTLLKNGMINIVFDAKENGKKIYEKW